MPKLIKPIENELHLLKEDIFEMWSVVISQLEKSKEAILEYNPDLGREVMKREKMIDALELHIDRDCETFMLLFQPVAVDLRMVLAILKINTELERIGDFAESIGQFAAKYQNGRLNEKLVQDLHLPEMFEAVITMLRTTEQALRVEDSVSATNIFIQDDMVDHFNKKAISILANYMRQYPEEAETCLRLQSIIRRIERIGDHCNNIAEDIVFFLDAKYLKHSKEKKEIKKALREQQTGNTETEEDEKEDEKNSAE